MPVFEALYLRKQMHSPVVVILKSIGQGIEEQIESILNPFDFNLYEEPIKQYLIAKDEIKQALKFRRLDSSLELLKLMQEEEPDDDIGMDEGGIWEYTEHNCKGEWDYWLVGGRFEDLLSPYKSKNLILPSDIESCVCEVKNISSDVRCAAIVTPDGKWHDSNEFGVPNYPNQTSEEQLEISMRAWSEFKNVCFKKYENDYAVIIDCHS
jgi:hypothetical protein